MVKRRADPKRKVIDMSMVIGELKAGQIVDCWCFDKGWRKGVIQLIEFPECKIATIKTEDGSLRPYYFKNIDNSQIAA